MSKQKEPKPIERIPSGIRNLDALLFGGIPVRSITVVGGTPGSGKTTLSQQICFHNATPQRKALFFQTLSEPTAKTLRYLQQFSFFDRRKLEDGSVEFADLGGIMRMKGLEQASALMMEHLRRVRPAIVVVDSFKVFNDLAGSKEELRKHAYQVAINLMAWECTGFLLGEFSPQELQENPVSSIVDGIIQMVGRDISGESQRFIQVTKMRGTDHARDAFPFVLNTHGIEIQAPRVTMRRDSRPTTKGLNPRQKTGIAGIDKLLGPGIPQGSSILVSGAAGTGKTLLLLESIYRGARELNEKGIFFSFEETDDRLLSAAVGMGWDLEGEIKRGRVEILFIPQPDVLVERDLLILDERVRQMQAKRVAVDSVSAFMYKMADPVLAREKIFQLATIVQNAGALGLFATDIPYGTGQISKFGVEESVVDGIVLLTLVQNGLDRERYLEVYKLRNTSHREGRHRMEIKKSGITVLARQSKKRPRG